MKRLFFLTIFLLACTSGALAQAATLYQEPTISRAQVVFAYAGDLWIVAREGGTAKRLTTGVGVETNPIFSPDGTMLAFTGEYDGNIDVYTVPTAGGVPKRLTYHPGADGAVGWTPDGKSVLFSSSRLSTSRYNRLFTMSLDGGVPVEVPLPLADDGAFSPDGQRLAYQPLTQWQPDWKRYNGGQTARIWIANLADSRIEKVEQERNSNDRNPMWIGDKVYFLSNRNGAVTLFAYDTKSKQTAQLVANSGLDIKSASATADAIVYEQFGTIHIYDLKASRARKLDIRLEGDLPGVRPRYERVGQRIASATLSPTGVRAVFEARGEILSVPAEKGDPRNLTNTTGVMERTPVWSPDGRWIAYFSDESGEYALHLRDQTGMGEVKKIQLPPTFYLQPAWSPDSKKLAFADKKLQLWYLEIENPTPILVDKNPIGFNDSVMDPVWSPDSKWIAYARQLPNLLRAVFAYSLDAKKASQLTDGMSDARYPAFDRSGKYLYFTASTNLGPAISFADLSGFGHQPTRSVYALVLRNDIPSPLAPESDEEKVQPEKKDEPKPAGEAEKKPDAATPPASGAAPQAGGAAPQAGGATPPAGARPPARIEPTRIDLEGIDQRIIALPIPPRNYVALLTGRANMVYLLEPPAPGASQLPGFLVQRFDLEKRKFDKVLEGVQVFEISANGEKVLYLTRQNWMIAGAATLGMPLPPGAPGAPTMLRINEMEVAVDPKAEWQQMYKEVWRGERDYFYDRNAHGLDLKAAERLYEPYLAAVAHRADLNYLFTEMLNQLTVGHMFIGGGDRPRPNFVPGGLLGADYKIENGRYRFARVYNGENWNPGLRAPLTQPGVNVKAGEYLLAVQGRELRSTDNLYQAFESRADKQVVIKVGPNPDGTGSREVTVVPVASEAALRNLAWIEGNRRKVEQMSGGKLAYIYMPDTANGGYASFTRYFFAQTDKEGALIDERFNSGGLLADYVVQHLSRQRLSMIHYREGGQDVPVPAGAIYGPKAMLINELAGSGGDAMPWYFKKSKIGPLIGKRTWGGLIASFRPPPLMDGGSVTAPDAAIYGLSGEWEVENVGVAPDIEVEFDPADWRQGRDPQLERAIAWLMEELQKNPRPQYKRPPFPNYHKPNSVANGGQR